MGINPCREAQLQSKLVPCHTGTTQSVAPLAKANSKLGLATPVWLGHHHTWRIEEFVREWPPWHNRWIERESEREKETHNRRLWLHELRGMRTPRPLQADMSQEDTVMALSCSWFILALAVARRLSSPKEKQKHTSSSGSRNTVWLSLPLFVEWYRESVAAK